MSLAIISALRNKKRVMLTRFINKLVLGMMGQSNMVGLYNNTTALAQFVGKLIGIYKASSVETVAAASSGTSLVDNWWDTTGSDSLATEGGAPRTLCDSKVNLLITALSATDDTGICWHQGSSDNTGSVTPLEYANAAIQMFTYMRNKIRDDMGWPATKRIPVFIFQTGFAPTTSQDYIMEAHELLTQMLDDCHFVCALRDLQDDGVHFTSAGYIKTGERAGEIIGHIMADGQYARKVFNPYISAVTNVNSTTTDVTIQHHDYANDIQVSGSAGAYQDFSLSDNGVDVPVSAVTKIDGRTLRLTHDAVASITNLTLTYGNLTNTEGAVNDNSDVGYTLRPAFGMEVTA